MSHKIENGVILTAAIDVAKRDGFNNLSRNIVAAKAGASPSKVSQVYSTMPKLRRAVMRYALQNELLDIIAAGLGIKDKTAMKASEELKRRALETLI